MRGIVLAGGLGTRLRPLTHITNKHLLPVYDRPMILYALSVLEKAGIKDILIVCGKDHLDHFLSFLGDGKEYGVSLSFTIQNKDNGGIADALSYAEDFSEEKNIAVILGDNIFDEDFSSYVESFQDGAQVFFREVDNPKRFGVPAFSDDGSLIIVEEKPMNPKSTYAQTGLYFFDSKIFSYINDLTPSKRGELEITDAINIYLEAGKLSHAFIEGEWFDVGTHDSLLEAANYMRNRVL